MRPVASASSGGNFTDTAVADFHARVVGSPRRKLFSVAGSNK